MAHRHFLLIFILLMSACSPVFASEAAPSGVVKQSSPQSPQDILTQADRLLMQGKFEEGEALLVEGIGRLGDEVGLAPRFALHYALSLVRVRRKQVAPAIGSFVEAIALADALESGNTQGFEGLPLSLRLELAGFLLDSGKAADSEALCWDALSRSLAEEEPRGLGPVVVALVSSVLAQTTDEAVLTSFLEELDSELSTWDGYRLSLPPPPEPIFGLLEDGAARLLAEGETDAARDLFLGILRLDRARGADWRVVSDLSAVAFSSLLLDDLPMARSTLKEVDASLNGEGVPIDVWANRCYLRAFEGRWEEAEAQCLGGIAAARSGGDERRAIAMTSVLAGLRALAGESRKAVSLHEDAAQRYDQIGAVQDAAGERARAIMVLVEGRHLDESLRLLDRLDQSRTGQPRHPLVEEARQRLALKMLQSSFESSDEDEVRTTLQNIGAYLFQTRRAVSLSELSLLYLDSVFRVGAPAGSNEDLEETVSAIVKLERELGLEESGWVGDYAQARLHVARGEREAAVELLNALLGSYEQRLLQDAFEGDSLRVWMGRGAARFYRRPAFEPHRLLRSELRALDRPEEAEAIEWRTERVRRALLWRQPAGAKSLSPKDSLERDFLGLRAQRVALEQHLIEVSLDGGETTPAEQRAAVAPLLAQLRSQESTALSSLSPARREIFSPGRAMEATQGREQGLIDLSDAGCRIGGLRGADVFLDVAGLSVLDGGDKLRASLHEIGVLGPAELADQSWPALVLLPLCPGGASEEYPPALALQDEALFSGGAAAVVRPTRRIPRGAKKVFRSSLQEAVAKGLSPRAAFEEAQAALRKRWSSKKARGFWRLKSP